MPAVQAFSDDLVGTIVGKKSVSDKIPCKAEEKMLESVSKAYELIAEKTEKFAKDIEKAEGTEDGLELAKFYHDSILKEMEEIRAVADGIEEYLPDDYLPYPTYSKMLFYV